MSDKQWPYEDRYDYQEVISQREKSFDEFDDSLLLKQGLEYSVIFNRGHQTHYLSRKTAEYYRDNQGAKIVSPAQGPHRPVCGDTGRAL